MPLPRSELDDARSKCASMLAQVIAIQEELDWWCYHAYGLLDQALCSEGSLPEVQLGERAFEIVLARRMASGEAQTKWFARHRSTPITELPAHRSEEHTSELQSLMRISYAVFVLK